MYDLERERESIRLASEEPDLTPEEEYEFYKKYALRTKKDLLTEIRNTQEEIRESDEKNNRSNEFYNRLDRLFDLFCEEIESHVIMEPLDCFWGYSFSVRETGITLSMNHFMLLYDYVPKDYPNWWKYSSTHCFASDDRYSLIETRAKLLTLEEYGRIHEVEAGTVRQWIRRGKLRSATKIGNEWRVPELADKPVRGYSDAHYYWKTDLPNPPEEIPDINEVDSLYTYKNLHTGEWTAKLMCMNKKGTDREVVLDLKAKEKLELYLISHPLVECLNNHIAEVSQKNGSEYEMMKVDTRFEEETE